MVSKLSHARTAVLMVGISLLVALCVLELVLRLLADDLAGLPDPVRSFRMLGGAHPARHDPMLGYVPTPGYQGSDNPWGLPVQITPDGVRSNGVPPPPGTQGRLPTRRFSASPW